MTDVLNIGGTNYGVVKAISSAPLAAYVPTTIAIQKSKRLQKVCKILRIQDCLYQT